MNNSEYKYTYLSSDEINDVLGLKHRELTERFNPILREIERSSAEKVNLEMILGIDHGPEQAKKMATELFAFIKEYLTEVFMDIALMQFLSMKKRDEWSIQGGQRIMISFCRCLYRIPPDRQLTQFDADRLLRLIADADERFGQLTGDEYFEISRTAIISLWELNMHFIISIVLKNFFFESDVRIMCFRTMKMELPSLFWVELKKRLHRTSRFFM
jgi:hypothetical protein